MPLSHYMQPFEAQKHAYKVKAKKTNAATPYYI